MHVSVIQKNRNRIVKIIKFRRCEKINFHEKTRGKIFLMETSKVLNFHICLLIL